MVARLSYNYCGYIVEARIVKAHHQTECVPRAIIWGISDECRSVLVRGRKLKVCEPGVALEQLSCPHSCLYSDLMPASVAILAMMMHFALIRS